MLKRGAAENVREDFGPNQPMEGHHCAFARIQIVDVANSSVAMTPAKVEVSMKKKEAGSWAKLEIPREQTSGKKNPTTSNVTVLSDQVESVDLGDL
ncbi:hypothetical protein GE061_017364 [Apolygus lucorum]|uniref:CS domain-containing protein n=1 Tax=Apolygus lucorum TaxID=248454 RepID=A0A8S9XC52_APOLU|nr:hypothetical protein GE061_017364 [Apolygus lucorum]